METPASELPCPPPLDFERASIKWVTKDNSGGRWRVIAACWSSHGGEHEQFVLSPRIMAGDVYGAGKLPLDPPYGFQIIASVDRHVIIRDFAGDRPSRDTSNSNSQIFSSLTIDAPSMRVDACLGGDSLTPEALGKAWPLTARLHVSKGGSDHLVDFPVHHLNTKTPGAFQVETGPVLLPAALIEDTKLAIGGFALAFVFFNRPDRADLAIWGPVSEGSARRAYIHFARLDGIWIEHYGGKGASRAS